LPSSTRSRQPGRLSALWPTAATNGPSRWALPRTNARRTPGSVWFTLSYKQASDTGSAGI
jgi:hypothetical protein